MPIYVQIAESIRRRIRSGKLKVGDRLESERQLASNFGVSLMTARQALQSLEEEGLIERRHGSGTFVRTPRVNWNRLMSFTEQMAERGLEASSRLVLAECVGAAPIIAEQLELPRTEQFFRVERIREGDGEPLAVEACYLPLSRFAGLDEKPLMKRSLFDVLEHDYGVSLCRADEVIEAQLPDKRVAKLLGIRTNDPVLHVRQILFGNANQPVAISYGWYRADKNSFTVVRTRLESMMTMSA